jgi:hypothetical protein
MTTRARGANAKAMGAFETAPGTVPGANWFIIPFVSHTLGEEQPLLTSDLLGQGRELQDPTPDVITNDGDIVVPVDARNIGRWLKLFFGDPTSTGSADDGYSHAFTSGAEDIPSMSIEIGNPEVPSYSAHYGARGNQLKITQARSGLLNATCSLICIGESDPVAASVASADASPLAVTRFPNAAGYVKKDGAQLGSVVGADFTYSNNLEKVETIKADGRIEDSDPGQAMMSGSITVRFKDMTLLNAASGDTPIELAFGWSVGDFGLVFTVPRVFLPKAKRPISGPNGIQAQFNWQASGATGNAVTATLINDVASY